MGIRIVAPNLFCSPTSPRHNIFDQPTHSSINEIAMVLSIFRPIKLSSKAGAGAHSMYAGTH